MSTTCHSKHSLFKWSLRKWISLHQYILQSPTPYVQSLFFFGECHATAERTAGAAFGTLGIRVINRILFHHLAAKAIWYLFNVRKWTVRTETDLENVAIRPTKSSSCCVQNVKGFKLGSRPLFSYDSPYSNSPYIWNFGWYLNLVRPNSNDFDASLWNLLMHRYPASNK